MIAVQYEIVVNTVRSKTMVNTLQCRIVTNFVHCKIVVNTGQNKTGATTFSVKYVIGKNVWNKKCGEYCTLCVCVCVSECATVCGCGGGNKAAAP